MMHETVNNVLSRLNKIKSASLSVPVSLCVCVCLYALSGKKSSDSIFSFIIEST